MVAFRLGDVAAAMRFLFRLRAFLRRPIRPEEAHRTLGRCLEQRESNFLALAGAAIYQNGASPYRRLLSFVGCEYGDLEKLVRQDGVEGALQALFRQGVYLTVEEFKGRKPVVRGTFTMNVAPALLRNPLSGAHVPARSSGSRGVGTLVLIDLAFVRRCALDMSLVFDARGGRDWLRADWEVPGGGAMFRLLKLSCFEAPPARWFSPVEPGGRGLHQGSRWTALAMRWGGRLAGVPLPVPEYVPVGSPLKIVHWMADVLRSGHTPHLHAFASNIVRVCRTAFEAGIDLRGARFMVMGEPVTEARLNAIRRVGAEALPRYGTIESGPIGYGCLAPEKADDMHFLSDLHALIQAGSEEETPGLRSGSLLLSSLCPAAPLIFFNVSMGDQAVVLKRQCGCRLEPLGWTTHLHTIRSFEKLTAAGMRFFDTDVIPVLEELLPARFGGGPTDYQLVEDDADDGTLRLRLLVNPAVGPVDEAAVTRALLSAMAGGSRVDRLVGSKTDQGTVLQVERRAPLTTGSGKILHLHSDRRRVVGV